MIKLLKIEKKNLHPTLVELTVHSILENLKKNYDTYIDVF